MAPQGSKVDLVTAREAVITWLMARRRKGGLRMEGHPEALKQLAWLGLDWEVSLGLDRPAEELWARLQSELGVRLRVFDRGRPVTPGPESLELAPLVGEVPDLESLGRQGILAEGVLSYLAESAWSPPGGKRFFTRQELLREFDPDALVGEPVVFDPEALRERHLNFLAELTPAELWERSLPYWESGLLPEELDEQTVLDLEAMALLLADQCQSLLDFPRLARFYFSSPQEPPDPELATLMEAADWEGDPLADLTSEQSERLDRLVLGPSTEGSSEIYLILGREKVLDRLSGRPSRGES